MEVSTIFKIELGGNYKSFEYIVKNDSIKFVGSNLNGWNDYEIVSLEKEKIVLKHKIDNSFFEWTMVPEPVSEKKKKK